MSRKFIVRPDVDEQVQSIHAYLNAARPNKGVEFVDELEALFERIDANPFLYAIVAHDIRAARIQRTSYVLHYFVTDDVVEVFSIMHGAQHPLTWRSRR
ncbi:type II toxin-antitoxin system RelE/ParE family toxin [Anatilimnocola floriformis]|uniref:type II toxin-antitoxin system RelE/ParE family toxin n=1 Tax=Anatilimnocola floriformis TaxID=2948575 RepID=UPI0020C32254|nr:type II toxin-antitoxin system RelE/ParE family toxin [Anatilimnocola floriformis]